MLATLAGDFNQDYRVDGNDFLAFQRAYGQAAAGQYEAIDQDGSGVVDQGDLDQWTARYGAHYYNPENSAPVLVPIDNREMSIQDDVIVVPFDASDPDGDPLHFLVRATAANPLAEIRDTYNLVSGGDYFPNLTGLSEKWLFAPGGNAFLLLPDGALLQWQGDFESTGVRESLVALLDPSVYDDPALLWQAPDEVLAPVTVEVVGDSIVIDPAEGAVGDFKVRLVASDGQLVDAQQFNVSILDDRPRFEQQQGEIERLVESLPNLQMDEIPGLLAELNTVAQSLSGQAAAAAYDLVRNIQQAYEQGLVDAAASRDWDEQQQRTLAAQLMQAEYIENELRILQGEFAAAWEQLSDNISDVEPVSDPESVPPIFVLGANPGPYSVEQGHPISVDLLAIHPFGTPRYDGSYQLLSAPETSGSVSVSLDNATGQFDWTPSLSNVPGDYTFEVVAEVEIEDRSADYPGFDYSGYLGIEVEAPVTFTVTVTPAVIPTIDSLHAGPGVITDSGNDSVVLTALGVLHETDTVDHVFFWQELNANTTYEHGVDVPLGYDLDGANGWALQARPRVEAGDSAIEVRAQATRLAGVSESVSATIEVIPSIQLPDSLVVPVGIDEAIDHSDLTSSTSHYAYYGDNSYVRVYVDESSNGDRLYAQWRPESGGSQTVEVTRLYGSSPYFGAIALSVDVAGNLLVAYSYHHDEADELESRLLFNPVDSGTSVVKKYVITTRYEQYLPVLDDSGNPVIDEYGDPVLEDYPTGRGGDFKISAHMNDSGVGFVTWDYDRPWIEGDGVQVGYSQNFQTFAWSEADGTYSMVRGDSRNLHKSTRTNSLALDWDDIYAEDVRWLTDISEDGEFALLWPGSGTAQDYIGRGRIELVSGTPRIRDYFDEPVLLNLLSTPTHLSIGAEGWMAVGGDDQFGIVSPSAVQVGLAQFVNGGPTSTGQMVEMYFSADRVLNVGYVSGGGFFYDLHQYRVNTADAVFSSALERTGSEELTAGVGFQVQVEMLNESSLALNDLQVAFYISQDGTLDLEEDRIVGSAQVGTLSPGQRRSVGATLQAPSNADPFWAAGSQDLTIFAYAENSGAVAKLTHPYVVVAWEPDGADQGRGFGEPQPMTGVYIRPGVALDQVDNPGLVSAIDTTELIGWQYVFALRQLELKAPPQLQPRIRALRDQAAAAMETYFQKRMSVDDALQAGLSTALQERDAAETQALRDHQDGLAAAQQRYDEILAANNQRISEHQAAYADKQSNAEAERDAKVDAANAAVLQAQAALSQHVLAGAVASFGLSWAEAGEKLFSGGAQVVDCVAEFDYEPCLEQAEHEYNRIKEDLTQALEKARENLVRVTELAEAALLRTLSSLADALEAVITPFADAITTAFGVLSDAPAILQAELEQALASAEAGYSNAVGSLSEVFAEGLEEVKQDIAPLFDAIPTKIGEAVEIIVAPISEISDLLETGGFKGPNPYGPVEDINDFVVENISDMLGIGADGIKDSLSDPNDFVVVTSGPHAEWSEHMGGNAIDWTQDKIEVVVQWVQENAIDPLLDQEIVVYKIETGLDFSLNLGNGSVYANATVGPGLSFDLRKINEILVQGITLPSIDPLAIADLLYFIQLEQTTNYDEVKATEVAAYGPQNVYFASNQFVDYFGAETLGQAVTDIVIGNGDDVLEELADQLRLELNNVLSFLSLKGAEAVDDVAANVLYAMLTQTDLETPQVELRWTPVTYHYEVVESAALGNIISTVAGDDATHADIVGGNPLGVDSAHAAFSIIWKNPDVPNPLDILEIDAALNLAIDGFDAGLLNAEPLDAEMLGLILEELSGPSIPDELTELAEFMLGGLGSIRQLESEFIAIALQELDLDSDLLRTYYKIGDPVIDLADTAVGNSLERFLDDLTFGNASRVIIDRLDFDLSSYLLTADITLCHRHSWGTVADAIEHLGDFFLSDEAAQILPAYEALNQQPPTGLADMEGKASRPLMALGDREPGDGFARPNLSASAEASTSYAASSVLAGRSSVDADDGDPPNGGGGLETRATLTSTEGRLNLSTGMAAGFPLGTGSSSQTWRTGSTLLPLGPGSANQISSTDNPGQSQPFTKWVSALSGFVDVSGYQWLVEKELLAEELPACTASTPGVIGEVAAPDEAGVRDRLFEVLGASTRGA